MEFTALTLDCITVLRPYFEKNKCRICDCTVGGTFLWRGYHDTQYAVEDGILYLKVMYPEYGSAFAPPRSGSGTGINRAAYERIIAYCGALKIPARTCAVSEAVRDMILEMFPGSECHTDRAWSDYLYNSADLIELPGRKYSGQRNHINRFKRENPDWTFEDVTESNLVQVRAFFEAYAEKNVRDSAAYDESNVKTLEALDNFAKYRLIGGVLKVSGEIVGASLGETVGDTLFVHIEKADTAYHGSYPMLVNQFTRRYAIDGIWYVNREEDDGVEGLRTSKLSYHPASLLDKYIVELRA